MVCTLLWRLCAGDFESAGFLRSPGSNLRTAATPSRGTEWVSSNVQKEKQHEKANTQSARNNRPCGRQYNVPLVCEDTRKLHEAADRALDFYLKPTAAIMATPYVQNQMFQVNPKADTESLLANASESLGSASVMLGDFAALLQGTHRKTLLGSAQVVMLGELAVNRALDNVEPTA